MKLKQIEDVIIRCYASHKDIPEGHHDGEVIGHLTYCKDCKYCRTYYHGENMPFSYACDKLYLTNNLSSDDYCSRGVREEE